MFTHSTRHVQIVHLASINEWPLWTSESPWQQLHHGGKGQREGTHCHFPKRHEGKHFSEHQVTASNEYGFMPFNAEPQKAQLTVKYIHVTHVSNGFHPHHEEQGLTYKTCFLKQDTNVTDKQESTMRAQAETRGWHTTLYWGTCSSGSCKTCWEGKRMNQTAQRWLMMNSPDCSMQIPRLQDCHDTDTGRRWHHYLECLHLLAWGSHHWRLCLQLHSRHCALCLQARQDNTVSEK